MEIREDDLTGDRVAAFVEAHLAEMRAITPPGSVHALPLAGLRAPDVTFWSVWDGDELIGCGALKELDPRHAEVKAMRTAEARRGEGIGSRLLEHLVTVARRRGYDALYLETGATPAFERTRAFYGRHGFENRGPFADYTADPNSVFMVKRL